MHTLGYREPVTEPKPVKVGEVNKSAIDNVIAARHLAAQQPSVETIKLLFRAVDGLAAEYGLSQLKGAIPAIISAANHLSRRERAQAIESSRD